MPTAPVNGISLYYETAGAGEPLLFIHGLGSSTRDWASQVDAFRDRFQCITFDVRGHGRSEKPPGPYSIAQFAADATGLLSHLQLDSAHVIGISMGGFIAFQMAVEAPACVRSMIIINSSPDLQLRTLRARLFALQRLILFRLLSMEQIGKALGRRLFPAEEEAGIREVFVARWAENDKRAYMDATRAGVGWSVREQLGSIEIPTLVIASDQDYTPVESKQAYVNEMPNAELTVIRDARHAVTITQPEKVNALIDDFLARTIAS